MITTELDKRPYQICSATVMDTSDPDITFDTQGVCSYVHNFDEKIKPILQPSEAKSKALEGLLKEIKSHGRGKEYDCIIGISGGVDSSYLAYYLKKKAGLRPLAVHLDGGWNSELAVKNIEEILKKLDIDLLTYVVDWEEMKDLQVAFLKSGVPNQDVPQDHAIIASLYKTAKEKKIKYIISGHNFATESILPKAWGYDAMDSIHLKSIHRKFGKVRNLKSYPLISFIDYYLVSRYLKKIQSIRFLNLIDYNKQEAMSLLQKDYGWRYYGGKHYESRFTKFFQSYYLPTRFGYDKRRAHLSSLIVSGQLSREAALHELEKPLYDPKELDEDKAYIQKKLDLSPEEFEEILRQPLKTHKDYPSNESVYSFVRNLYLRMKKIGKKSRNDDSLEYVIRF
ncbi:MAG: N-acetyl sugar amidotransferase [Cyclobacteriaceae bacterium]|nr:N-acetyl sugar amidotransferase [Flavobacteriaceae bacterium]MCB0491771.1 N-acetyl sugar amidotransferase [Cyclobacteriaceae bacterium]